MTRFSQPLETDNAWGDQTIADFGTEETFAAPAPATAPAAPDQSLALEPGSAVGEYQIAQVIGQGGMATVFAAVHPVIGKRAAIKVLSDADPAACARFVQEARAVNEIGHPNIVDIFSMGTLPDGRSYLVMEWLKGRDLAQELTRGPLSIPTAVDMLDQIADALQAAHEHDIAHRDLKPDNVFITDSHGRRDVKLLDFGIAKLIGKRAGGQAHTQAGLMVGTPGYMSPEQARGLEVDHRTDIYSLGMVAFEMVCGRAPFQAETDMDLILCQLREEPPAPSTLRPDLPTSLDSLIRRMIEKNPDYRPTLTEVRATLARLRAARFSPTSGAYHVADIPSLAMMPTPTPLPMPRFRAVGTPPPVMTHCPEVTVTFRTPSRDDRTQTCRVKLPAAVRAPVSWRVRFAIAGVCAALTATVAMATAYLT